MRKLTYTNAKGEEIELFNSPYLITKLEGISNPDSDVQTEKAPYIDGQHLIDTIYNPRVITVEFAITATDYYSIAEHRRIISKAFRRIYDENGEIAQGVLKLENDYGTYTINGVPATVVPADRGNSLYQKYQVIFDCPNPIWQGANAEVNMGMSYETPELFFGSGYIMVSTDGIIFGTTNSIKEIDYDGDVEAPVIITFNGPAVSPTVKNNTTGLQVKVNKTLNDGEQLIIDTTPGAKSIALVQNGVKTSAYNYITPDTKLWQLVPGLNEIQYASDDNNPNATVNILYTPLFIGV